VIYKYGIDFGTTNSSIALRFVGDDAQEHTQVIDVKDTLPKETLPSIVHIDPLGKISVGTEAVTRYLQGGLNSGKQLLIKKIKLDLEERGSDLSYTVAGKTFSGVDLIAAVLRHLRVKAEAIADEFDIDVSGVVMGVPVEYGDIQKNVLKTALVKAGYYTSEREANLKTEFVSEPVAVAVHYGLNLEKETTVLVFDFGGGTLDLAVVNLKKQIGPDHLHPHETIAKARITLGGEELTRLFFIRSFCSASKYGMKKICAEFGFDKFLTPEQVWDRLTKCAEGIRFIEGIEQCKCDLSMSHKTVFSYVGSKNIQFEKMTFYRDDFTSAIEDKLDEIDDLVMRCLSSGGIEDPHEIDKVILAGGSSLVAAVQDVLINRFGPKHVMLAKQKEVMTSIVRGLAAVGCRKEDLVEDVVDSDYGVWDDLEKCFIPIIHKGIPVKKTKLNKLSQEGISDDFDCTNPNANAVEVLIYQRNLTGEHKLGTIKISNPGGKKYRIYMQIDKAKGILEVVFYDIKLHKWIDDIPLNQRQYTIG